MRKETSLSFQKSASGETVGRERIFFYLVRKSGKTLEVPGQRVAEAPAAVRFPKEPEEKWGRLARVLRTCTAKIVSFARGGGQGLETTG